MIIALLFGMAVPVAAGYCYDDGFGSSRQAKGTHFTVFYSPSLDPVELAMKLDIRPHEMLGGGGGSTLTEMLDSLFTRVCDILDMQLYSYEGSIKICRDADQLNSVYRKMFGRRATVPSFYVSELNTIYVDLDHFTRAVIGHEMGHAIMCRYFVVAPPEKVSEVMAGYVEYQLRKQ